MPDQDCFSKRLGPFFQKAARLVRDGADPASVGVTLAKATSILMRRGGFEMPMLKPMLEQLERSINQAVREKNDLFQAPDVGRKQFLIGVEAITLEFVSKTACRLVAEAAQRSFERLSERETIGRGEIKQVLFSEIAEGLLDYSYFSKGQDGMCAGRNWNSEQFEQFKVECGHEVGPQITNLLEQSLHSEDGKPTRESRKSRRREPARPLDIHASLEIEGAHGY